MTLANNSRRGFSLTEVVVGIVLIAIVWLSAINVIVVSRASGAFARHKAQAVYRIQQTIEGLRQGSFSSIVNSTTTVSVDTMGTPDNTADDITGTQYVTVATYNSTLAASVQSYKTVKVEIDWKESFFGKQKTVKE
jgi:prepilin-type N-terminal cleavage/methylation domain-containing protein